MKLQNKSKVCKVLFPLIASAKLLISCGCKLFPIFRFYFIGSIYFFQLKFEKYFYEINLLPTRYKDDNVQVFSRNALINKIPLEVILVPNIINFNFLFGCVIESIQEKVTAKFKHLKTIVSF